MNKWLLLAGFIIALVVLYQCGNRVEFVDRVQVDTVTIERIDTIFILKEETRSVHHWDTVYQDTVIIRELPVLASRYIDSVALSNAMLHYNIAVVGELYSTDFRLVSKIPQINRTITNTVTREINHYPSGIYANVAFNTGIGPGAGAMFLKNRWAYGYEYYFSKTHTVRLGYRIR